MFNWFKPPTFADDEKSRLARILNILLWVVSLALSVYLLIQIFYFGVSPLNTSFITLVSLVVVSVIGLVLIRRGHTQLVSWLFLGSAWLVLLQLTRTVSDIGGSAFLAQIVVILMANLLLGWKIGIFFSVITIAVAWMLGLGNDDVSQAIDLTIIFGISAVVMALSSYGLQNALKRARESEADVMERNKALEAFSHTLEDQVKERTRRLELVANMGERLSIILEVDPLLEKLVYELKQAFNYYHIQVFILEREGQNLVARAGLGEAGADMKNSHFSISKNALTSLIARSARTAEIVRIDNVHETDDWLSHPLLPHTLSEIALPIMLEGYVVGVLDVQEDKLAAFDEADINLLRSLANQVAIAIRNARLFSDVRSSLDEAQAVQEQYVIQSWDKNQLTRQTAGSVDIQFSESTAKSEAEISSLVTPVQLRGLTIGNLLLEDGASNRVWSDGEMALINAVAEQVAQVAENMRLFEETRRRASREQAIREITDKLRAAPTLESLIAVATQELGERLAATHTKIHLGTQTDSLTEDNGAEQPRLRHSNPANAEELSNV